MSFTISTRVCLLAIVAVAALAFAACGGGGGGEEIVRERVGVQLTLSADRDSYQVGDGVKLKAEVENVSGELVTYRIDGESKVEIELRVASDLGGTQVINASDEALDPAEVTVLEDGEKLQAEIEWDQILALYQTPAQAPAGDYVVSARFLVADPDGGTGVAEVTATLTLTLEGGREILPAKDAILLAVQQPKMREWAAARGVAGAICVYQPTENYYSVSLVEPLIADSFGNFYDTSVRNGDPICSPVSIGEEWRVQFFNANGPEPNRVAVNMDLYTGENPRFTDAGFERSTDDSAD